MSNTANRAAVARIRAYLQSINHAISQTQGYEVLAVAQGHADANVLAAQAPPDKCDKATEKKGPTEQDIFKLTEAASGLLTAFSDLLNGYPVRELHKPPEDIQDEAYRALAVFLGNDAVEEAWGVRVP